MWGTLIPWIIAIGLAMLTFALYWIFKDGGGGGYRALEEHLEV